MATYDESTPNALIDDDYTINSFAGGTLSVQYQRVNTKQVPFLFGIRGPISLRGRVEGPKIFVGKTEPS